VTQGDGGAGVATRQQRRRASSAAGRGDSWMAPWRAEEGQRKGNERRAASPEEACYLARSRTSMRSHAAAAELLLPSSSCHCLLCHYRAPSSSPVEPAMMPPTQINGLHGGWGLQLPAPAVAGGRSGRGEQGSARERTEERACVSQGARWG
jgi:hypothetical protein